MMKVEINRASRFPFSEKAARNVILTAARLAKLSGEVEVNVIGEKMMLELNSRYRRQQRATDVLSFAWAEGKKRGNFLGQIFICYPRIKQQAKEYKVGVREEFARMLAHGFLHLTGYEHKKAKEKEIMFALQEKIVKRVRATAGH